jgi:hypothetical protein
MRKKASCNVSCRCSTSTISSSSISISWRSSTDGVCTPLLSAKDGSGFHVAPEGITTVLVDSRPSAKAASASAAAAAMAFARSILNCLRCCLLLAVTSSEVTGSRVEYFLEKDANYTLLPANAAFLALICLESHVGSLLDRSPLPKKPLRHSIAESLEFVTQTERVRGSNIPSQEGLCTNRGVKKLKMEVCSEKVIGSGEE